MKTTNKIHYVYKITNLKPTDERLYYIGVKSSFDPLTDNYMGTSKYLDVSMEEIGKENFKKEVLSIWKTRKLAMQEEIRLHEEFDVACNKIFYNKCKAKSTKFDITGMSFNNGFVPVRDLRDNTTKQVSKSDFDTFDYYEFITSGTVLVVDLRVDETKRVSTEDYNKFSYYESINTDRVSVVDTRNNTTKQVSKSDFDTFDYYVSCMKGTISVYDTRDKKTKKVSTKDYKVFNHYKSKDSKHYNIYSNTGKLIYEVFGVFKKFCKENGLPYDTFMNSYKNNGKPLYQSANARSIKPEFIKYKGWYALKQKN